MRAFALTIPGLGPLLADQACLLGIDAGAVEHDGRADVVPLSAVPPPGRLPIAEVVCAELAHVRIGSLAATVAAIGVRSPKVMVRLQHEDSFRRRALRDALVGRGGGRELWVVQTSRHRLRVGRPVLRAPSGSPRPGALRPAAAAAMLHVLGPPAASGALLDPCAGSGTNLAAARHVGWHAVGGDIEPLVHVRLDARRLPFADDTFDAVASNLPFGTRYVVQGTPVAWYRRTLSEMLRVAPHAVVLAAPSQPFRQALGRLRVDLVARHDLVLLGKPTTLWHIRRAGGS